MGAYIILSLVGVVAGAVLQYWFAQRAEAQRSAQTLRTEAYVDLVKSIAGLSKAAADTNSERYAQLAVLYTEARARVVIYGSTAVVSRLAALLRLGTDLQSAAAAGALVEVVKAMRAEGMGVKQPVSDPDVRQVLFGRD